MLCGEAIFSYRQITRMLVNEDGYEEDSAEFWSELYRRYQPTEDVVEGNKDPKKLSYVERQDWDGTRIRAQAAA